MLKKLRVISILLCGVIFLNGLCICRASAAYTPKLLMVPDEQSIVDQIDHARHDKNNFKGIINEIDQYYKGKDSEGKSREYSKEFKVYCLSVLFKLYNEILKPGTLYKEFLGPQSKVSKERIPNIKEVIFTGVGVIEGLNDTTNLSYPTLLYRVLNLELDKKRNKSMSQCLDSGDKDISRHIESILKNGKNLLGSGIFEQADFETLPMVTQLNLLRCVGICEKNVGLLLSDEELHKILQQISGLSLGEYQKDLKEMKGPTTSSSSSSSSSSSNEGNKNLEVKILIQFARIQQCSDNGKISALNAVIDYFGGVEKAAKYEQGREALIQLGRILQYSGNERIIALRSVINYFGNFEVAAKDAQGREALIQLGRIPHDDGKEQVSALNAAINYFGNFEIAAKDAQGREALIALGRIPHDDGKGQVRALNAVINYFFRLATPPSSSSKPSNDKMYQIAAKDAQGREALIALGRIPHDDGKEEVSALNAVINYFGNFEVAANYEQGREALLQWCRIPENNNSKKVAILKILKKKNYKLADVCRITNILNKIRDRSYDFDNSILVGNRTGLSFSPPSSTSLRTNSISPNSFGQGSIKSSYLNSDVISNSPFSVSSNSPSSPSSTFYYQGKGGRNSLSPPPQSHFSSPPSSTNPSPATPTSSSRSLSSENNSKSSSPLSSSLPSVSSSTNPSPEIPASSKGSSFSDSDQIIKVPLSFSDLPNTPTKNSKSSSPSSSSLPSVSSSNSSSPEPPASSNGSSFSLRSKILSLKLSSHCPRFYPRGMSGVNNDQSQQPSNTSGNSTQGTSHNSLSKNPDKDINSSSSPSYSVPISNIGSQSSMFNNSGLPSLPLPSIPALNNKGSSLSPPPYSTTSSSLSFSYSVTSGNSCPPFYQNTNNLMSFSSRNTTPYMDNN